MQYSAVRDSALWYSALRYSALRYSALRYSALRYSALRYGTVRYGTVLYLSLKVNYIFVQTGIVYNMCNKYVIRYIFTYIHAEYIYIYIYIYSIPHFTSLKRLMATGLKDDFLRLVLHVGHLK